MDHLITDVEIGAAVTMPHKITIMKHLDHLADICREVGACNTIFITEKKGRRVLCGTNTDVIGVREAFYCNVAEPDKTFENRPVMIIGGGGAARSAIYAAQKWMRATQIYLVNRDELEIKTLFVDCENAGHSDSLLHVSSVAQALELPSPGSIISCIPDFVPQTPEEKLVREILEVFLRRDSKGVLLDMCYAPSPRTRINTLAEQEGWQVIPGTEMMIWQALEQVGGHFFPTRKQSPLILGHQGQVLDKPFTGRDASAESQDSYYREASVESCSQF